MYSIFIVLFPFIVDARSILDICFWKGFTRECAAFQLSDQLCCSIWAIIHSLFSLILTVISISYSKKNGYTAVHKVETRLLLQTTFSSAMIVVSAAFQLLSVMWYRNRRNSLFIQYSGWSEIIVGAYFYPVILVLFFARYEFGVTMEIQRLRTKILRMYLRKILSQLSTLSWGHGYPGTPSGVPDSG